MSAKDVEKLRELRINGDSKPALVVDIGPVVLQKGGLGNEAWTIREQVVQAGIEEYDRGVVTTYFREIQQKFPQSKRERRLNGMILEAQGTLKDAAEIYKKLSKDDPTDLISQKRGISILKAKGDIQGCIVALNEYLQMFVADEEAWHELCDLYLHQAQFQYAAFCLEEVLIADRWNRHIYNKYADILYSNGTKEDILLARKYYSYSISINSKGENVRALYGLCLATSALLHDFSQEKTPHNISLYRFGESKIRQAYTEECPQKKVFVEKFLASIRPEMKED